MDKVLELCFRSVIRHLSGDKDLSKKYRDLALDEYDDHENIARVEDYVDRKTKRKLYEMGS